MKWFPPFLRRHRERHQTDRLPRLSMRHIVIHVVGRKVAKEMSSEVREVPSVAQATMVVQGPANLPGVMAQHTMFPAVVPGTVALDIAVALGLRHSRSRARFANRVGLASLQRLVSRIASRIS